MELRRRFLTPHVHGEVIKIATRISAYTLLLKGKVSSEGMSPSEAFQALKQEQPGWVNTRLERYLSNIVSYYQQAYEEDLSLEQAEQRLQRVMSTYEGMADRVRPASPVLEEAATSIDQYRSFIRSNDLVDEWDEEIIIQLQVYNDSRGKPLTLVTENLKDFAVSREEWSECFPEIAVVSPATWMAA